MMFEVLHVIFMHFATIIMNTYIMCHSFDREHKFYGEEKKKTPASKK